MTSNLRLPLVLQALIFCIPLNIYVIGDGLATGLQWALFRYQQSYLGNSFILITRDVGYVSKGILTGTTAISYIVWIAGSVLLMAAFIITLLAYAEKNPQNMNHGALCIIAAGILFGISLLVQYGMLLNNLHGFSVPVGIPLILIAGWWIYHGDYAGTGDEEAEDDADPAPAED
ncbi:MAG: hypothetical protein ABFC71_06900 [Methanoregula sp.]